MLSRQTRLHEMHLLHNITPSRLFLRTSTWKRASGSCDLFVDSLFYGAHTTAADALWAGLPLLTLRGYGVGES